MNRRQLLGLLGAPAGVSLLPQSLLASFPPTPPEKGFVYCLNMATIKGHKLGFARELEVSSRAGFKAVEIWIDSLQAYLDGGGTLLEAKKMLDGYGIRVESAIGFAEWIVDDEERRKRGLEKMKREMNMLAELGCKRTAAPPAGATGLPLLDLKQVAQRYRAVLEIGAQTGVTPQLEMWGPSKNLARASEVMFVAMESGDESARILLDVFHLYKGGSPVETLSLIRPGSVEILHMNDYAANMPAATITDADRVYPGDGIAPIKRILKTLKSPQKPLVLSVEVFNKNYYSQDALLVAKTALAKVKAVSDGL